MTPKIPHEQVRHMREHPAVMDAFDKLAATYGQMIEGAVAGPNPHGVPKDDYLVRYIVSQDILAVIHADGTTEILL